MNAMQRLMLRHGEQVARTCEVETQLELAMARIVELEQVAAEITDLKTDLAKLAKAAVAARKRAAAKRKPTPGGSR